MSTTQSRRRFLASVSMLAAGAWVPSSALNFFPDRKLKVALVGTGIRGTGFWGRDLVDRYGDLLEFVGLCDHNPGRLDFAQDYMGVSCGTYTDFDAMVREGQPDLVIVTTTDATHHRFIIQGLEMGCDVLTEKPMTIDEEKCQDILDAERRSDNDLIVGFNYRWSPYMTRIRELLDEGAIGRVTSVDFHWYLNTYHGASYFRRWHGEREHSGTLLVHKATHHFDLLNWWLQSEPTEVVAYGDLEHYGSNNDFRGDKCRTCPHTDKCDFYWDITEHEHLMNLYVDHEEHDGYIRDNCLFRHDVNIYDKMSAQIRYANNVTVNYSLTTYSPFEGWRIAFNGTDGRIEAWQDIPWMDEGELSQEELHEMEMDQDADQMTQQPIVVHNLWEDHEVEPVTFQRGGHGGGDQRLQDRIFRETDQPDPLGHMADSRDGAMSILIGIGARNSIETGDRVHIANLTDLQPRSVTP